MDIAINLYDSLVNSIEMPELKVENKKWYLLACDMVLKEHDLNEKVYIRSLEIVLGLTESPLSENDWIFIISSTRKGIKRLNGTDKQDIPVINEALNILLITISDNSKNIKCTDHLLKLVLTCKEKGIPFEYPLEHTYHFFNDLKSVDYDEFYFIETEKMEVTVKQRCQRLLLLIDPLREVPFDYCFALFSVSDSELIKYMKGLIHCDQRRFLKFYTHVIKNELLSVDFFIEQLLTDSVVLLELLLIIFATSPVNPGKDFRNFHTLLLLKLELSADEFPFDCTILIKKLALFLNKI